MGKTRLALAVANAAAQELTDGAWFVDLVPVTDPLMVAPAIVAALHLGELPGRSPVDNVLTWMAGREVLLVLDNCEHLLDGVVVLLEPLLAGSPRSKVTATSRARLLVPFEGIFSVPGLSVEPGNGGTADAIQLFLDRAAAAGTAVRAGDEARVAVVCRGLDGMALAIELAAARMSALGLDGLTTGLADRLDLLAGGSGVDDRHRSLRSTLNWSYALLDEPGQAVLRRTSVFARPFTASAAAVVMDGWPPVAVGGMSSVLAGLVEHSLLMTITTDGETCYRAVQTIRQYGADLLDGANETRPARMRHARWCLDHVGSLELASLDPGGGWLADFDAVADELRAALAWSAAQAPVRAEAYQLAVDLGDMYSLRGFPGESQRRFEQAAELAADELAAADAMRRAAGAAEFRHVGSAALRLRARAAELAIRAGDRPGAAHDLAGNAELINRGPGLMEEAARPGEVRELLDRGWALADGDPVATARLLTAEAFDGRHRPGHPGTGGAGTGAGPLIGSPLSGSARGRRPGRCRVPLSVGPHPDHDRR